MRGQLIEGVIIELEPILPNAIRMLGLELSSPFLNKLQAELLAAGQFVYRRIKLESRFMSKRPALGSNASSLRVSSWVGLVAFWHI